MKLFKNLVLTLAISTFVITSTPSANAALIFAPVGAIMAVTCITGAAIIGIGELSTQGKAREGFWGVGGFLIIMDKNTQEVEMKAVDAKTGLALGLTSSELIAYNNELPRINAAFSELSSILANGDGSVAVQKDALAQFKTELSPKAFSATQKILKSAAK